MLISIEQLSESPLNTRKLFGDLSELAESIKTKGILQSILVRPLEKGRYEIVAGHRRVRAAKMAGLADVPADVRELTDEEVVEISVVENCQRKDINPVEEGEGYKSLFEKYKKPVAEIAAAVNKSEAHVRQRMQLVLLPKDALDALAGGELPVTVALALARLPDPKVRTEASKEILAGEEVWTEEPPFKKVRQPYTIKEALRLIREHYNLRLDENCGFNLHQSNLVPSAGACETCPKRSLNNPVLFPDLAPQDDLCTDPACFAKKKEAGWQQKKAELEAAGRKVLEGKEAAEIVGEYGQLKAGYVRLSDKDYNDPKGRSAEQILGKKGVSEHIVLVRGKDGKTHELVPKAAVAKALKKKLEEAGVKSVAAERAAPKLSDKEKADREAERIKAAAKDRALYLTVGAVIAAAQNESKRVWHLLAELLIDQMDEASEGLTDTAARRGLLKYSEIQGKPGVSQPLDDVNPAQLLKAELEGLAENGAQGLALELAMEMRGVYSPWGNDGKELLERLCRLFKVTAADLKAFEKEALATVKKEAEAKAAAAESAKKPEKKSKKALKVGDVCHFREGAFRFEAFVIRFEKDGAEVVLERIADGKRVTRAIDKVEV